MGKRKEPEAPATISNSPTRGVGRRVVAKILAGSESDGDIRKAIENFPMSERRRRYEAAQAEKNARARLMPSLALWSRAVPKTAKATNLLYNNSTVRPLGV